MKLTDEFQLLASAPNGVARLRDLILSLAVQGKLVPQEPNDEPAAALLQKISCEKDRLIAAGIIKRDKPQPEIAEKECLFVLPQGWQWSRLQSCFDVRDGTHDSPKFYEQGVPFVTSKNLSGGRLDLTDTKKISPDDHLSFSIRSKVDPGDILFAMIGSIGNPCIVDTEIAFSIKNVALFKYYARHLSVPEFLLIALKVSSIQMRAGASGGVQSFVSLGNIRKTVIAVPPLAEQARIVAKVNELMRLCDELEAHGGLEAEQHTQLTATLFDALAASESSHALAENWSRIAAHFDLLLDRPEAVDALEQTILQLAVRGLLVPQKPDDEPASAVLLEVATKRERLFGQGKTGRSRKAPSEDSDEAISVPRVGWEMVTFPDLCVIGGGATPSKAKAAYWDGKLPWVSPKDMKVEYISDAQDHVSELALQETRLPLVPERSLLIVVRGMILAHSFPVGITQVEVTINQDMKSLTPIVPALVPYLALVCRGFKREILELVDRSTHGTCKLQSDKLFAFRFGLPPLAEQSRILARVEELRHLCESLRAHLTARQTCQAHVAEALVEQAASTAPLAIDTNSFVAAA